MTDAQVPADFELVGDEAATLDLETLVRDSRPAADPRFGGLDRTRVALARGVVSVIAGGSDFDGVLYDIPLMCFIHSPRDLELASVRVIVDLSDTPHARIVDMAPLEVGGIAAVELRVNRIGARFEIKQTRAQTGSPSRHVFAPGVVSAGVGFHKAYWEFAGEAAASVNRELRVLAGALADATVIGQVTVRVRVRSEGRVYSLVSRFRLRVAEP